MAEVKQPKKRKLDKDSKEAIKQYKTEWEKETWAKGWLTENKNYYPDSSKTAWCTVCKKAYISHAADLRKHAESSQTHLDNMEKRFDTKQLKLTNLVTTVQTNSTKIRDMKLTVYIAMHSSIRSADHLCEILRNLECKDLKLHRTKVTNLIKCAIEPNLLRDLLQDIGSMGYSLIVDESSDIAKIKYLCLCVKYFSVSENRIVTDFLGLLEIDKADAQTLFTLVKAYLMEVLHLSLKNMLAIGSDGGSNLCGKNNSLFAYLKKENPHIILIRCICHSLNLAASSAAAEFPSAVEFLVREIYNWFSNSPLRRTKFKRLWDLLNFVDESMGESVKEFRQFVKLSSTRWLARYNAVKVIINQYFELKKHFQEVANDTEEKCYTGRLLSQMLNDNTNYLYLKIVQPVLFEINAANLTFQEESVDVGIAYDCLKDLILLLSKKIMKPQLRSNNLSLVITFFEKENAFCEEKDADYGIEYYAALLEHKITEEQKAVVEKRAFNYMKKLCQELISRLPDSINHFDRMKRLSTDQCLQQKHCNFSDLPFTDIYIPKERLGLVENQYLKLLNVDWPSILSNEQINNTSQFWAQVYIHKQGGKFIFRELALYVLTLLSLPTSNAVVERVFSIMNLVKTKVRNRMRINLLSSLLRIKIHFYSRKTCCTSFKPTAAMLDDFNSKVLYADQYEPIEGCEGSIDAEDTMEILETLQEFDWPCAMYKNQ